jgi:hypothetical protein
MKILTESAKMETRSHRCGKLSDKANMKTLCKAEEDKVKNTLGFSDYDCNIKYCEKDLCNSGKVAQMSLLLLGATIGLCGLFF